MLHTVKIPRSHLAMSDYSAERWQDILDGILENIPPFDDSPVMQMRDRFQEFVRGSPRCLL